MGLMSVGGGREIGVLRFPSSCTMVGNQIDLFLNIDFCFTLKDLILGITLKLGSSSFHIEAPLKLTLLLKTL